MEVLWLILAMAAQDAPSNDEVAGFVLVFILIGIAVFIAYFFTGDD